MTTLSLYGQDITGQWNGLLKVQGIQLRVVFNNSKSGTGFSSMMDSPDQVAKGIPVTSTSFENSVLKLAVTNLGVEYEGTLTKNNNITGTQNRNEELLGHKPFLVLADHLTRKGIAVLRFDDRGTAESTGDFKIATSTDFGRDVESAIKYLQTRKEVNKKLIMINL